MSASITSGTYPRARIATGPGWTERVWQFLCGLGTQRAAPHLLALAMQYERTNPALARQLRDTARQALQG